jgi:NAD(P)-dependent dehydrogenase (short-subunit alcohol dehydrogenase family)
MKHSPVVIVTGASRGIGAAVASWLGKIGAAVTLVARESDGLTQVDRAVKRLGGNSFSITADVADPDACRRVVQKTIKQFGQLDALVNNAGILEPLETVARAGPESWRHNLEVNLLGPVYMTMAAISELRRRKGRIVNVSSGAARSVIEAASAYCVSKAGLNQFTHVLAAEEPAVTVIAVRPGVVDTQMQKILRHKGPEKMPAQQAAYYLSLKTENKLEPPQVPARAIAWLALSAPRQWSGAFMSYDDPPIAGPALQLFGDKFDG